MDDHEGPRPPIRVRMPSEFKMADIAVTAQPPDHGRMAQRFYFDVSEDMLAMMGGHALIAAVERLGEMIAASRRQQIDSQVMERLMRDPTYMAPIIERAFTESVKEVIRSRIEWWTDDKMRGAIKDAVCEVMKKGMLDSDGDDW